MTSPAVVENPQEMVKHAVSRVAVAPQSNYNVIMKAKLVRIGNSKGVRLPKTIIAQYRFSNEIDIEPRPDGIILRPAQVARAGWDAAFRRMREQGDDQLLQPDTGSASEWDTREWTW